MSTTAEELGEALETLLNATSTMTYSAQRELGTTNYYKAQKDLATARMRFDADLEAVVRERDELAQRHRACESIVEESDEWKKIAQGKTSKPERGRDEAVALLRRVRQSGIAYHEPPCESERCLGCPIITFLAKSEAEQGAPAMTPTDTHKEAGG